MLAKEQNCYTLESLMDKWKSCKESLDFNLKNEFQDIKNFQINKTFDDSLKIHNARKSRYKHIYPCKRYNKLIMLMHHFNQFNFFSNR